MYFKKWASCLVPNTNLQLPSYCGQPGFGFKQFLMVESLCVTMPLVVVQLFVIMYKTLLQNGPSLKVPSLND